MAAAASLDPRSAPDRFCVQVAGVSDIQSAEKLVFPGVGAFEQAMGRLKSLGYEQALKDYIQVEPEADQVQLTPIPACCGRVLYTSDCVAHIMNNTLHRPVRSAGRHFQQPAAQPPHEQALPPVQAGRPFLGICLGLHVLYEGSDENGGIEGLGILPGRVTQFDAAPGLPVPHIGWNDLQQRCKPPWTMLCFKLNSPDVQYTPPGSGLLLRVTGSSCSAAQPAVHVRLPVTEAGKPP